MPVVPEAFREEYRSLIKAHIDALTQAFSAVARRLHRCSIRRSRSIHALFRYLRSHAKMMKSGVAA
jgi:hypothetical protein